MAGQQMADEGSREAFDELELFIRASLPEGSGFIALKLMPAGLAGPPHGRPDRPFIRLAAALGLRPRRALSSAPADSFSVLSTQPRNSEPALTGRIPLLIAQTCPVLIAPRHRKNMAPNHAAQAVELRALPACSSSADPRL